MAQLHAWAVDQQSLVFQPPGHLLPQQRSFAAAAHADDVQLVVDGDKVVLFILSEIGVWVESGLISTRLLVGALVAMGMNIKDPQVHAMARELAARRGTTVTDAVRRALAAELERSPEPSALKLQDAKLQQLLALLGRFSNLRWPDQRTSKELQDALYDDDGLPV